MRQVIVAGNWKLNGSSNSIRALITEIKSGVATLNQVTVAVCPPYVYIPLVSDLLQGSVIQCGAQDVSEQASGAFTGEVSAAMLRDLGCSYTLVGHSERRALYGERNEVTAAKFVAAQQAGLQVILCVGETLEEREAEQTEGVVQRQLDAVINSAGIASFANAVIAYEPVWAIGTGRTASPAQAQAVHRFIRGYFAKQDVNVADKISILYGGSVKADNAAELFAMPDIDGGLIGGASLQATDFLAICQAGQQQA